LPPKIRIWSRKVGQYGATTTTESSGSSTAPSAKNNASLPPAVADEYEEASRAGAMAMATTGGKEALFLALGAVLEPEDSVVVVAPYWPTFLDQIRIFGGKSVVVPPSPGATPEALVAACRGAAGVIVNTPGNPSGQAWSRAAAEAVVAHAKDSGAWILVDAVYAALTYGQAEIDAAWFLARCPDRTLVVDAASKRLALPGVRVGWALGPAVWIDGMRRLQDASTTHPSRFGQAAALAGLRSEAEWLPSVRARLQRRASALRDALTKVGLEMNSPVGGLFGLVHLPDGVDDVSLARRLIERRSLKTVPGSAFGTPGTLRLALRASEDVLRAAAGRIADELNSTRR
ncbi:MAG: pyridoxal phosphate-dependent aminotransferase, partial [Myxococcota bacterium]